MSKAETTGTELSCAKARRDATAKRAVARVARVLFLLLAALAACASTPSAALAQSVAWTQRVVSGPSARYNHSMAFDGARGFTVLIGGDGGLNTTSEWNGKVWAQRAVSGPATIAQAMAYDSARGITVLFGVSPYQGPDLELISATWEWDGTAWTQQMVSGPTSRYEYAMAYDAARGVIVFFGGWNQTRNGTGWTYYAETWEWNATAWTRRVGTGPSGRHAHAMAYDAARGVTVLFGGSTALNTFDDETWEWNGTAWTRRVVTGPSGRYAHAMAYDAARGVTVLFGGRGYNVYNGSIVINDETWEWNGMTWTQRGGSGPSGRYDHAMAYDAARGVTVLFGGQSDPGANAETWELAAPCFAPSITTQPVDQAVGVDVPVAFFVEATSATGCTTPEPLTYQWQRRDPAIADPNAANAWISLTDGGGFLNTTTSAMLITRPTPALATIYRCQIGGGCRCDAGPAPFTYTDAVNFSVACPADFNADGGIDGLDVQAFFERWEAGC